MTSETPLTFRAAVGGMLVISSIWATPGDVFSEEFLISSGQKEYIKNCAACHGDDGKGKGPFWVMLKARPSDLTQLSKRNNGEYPFDWVMKIIDGREIIKGHGTREMPILGERYSGEYSTNRGESSREVAVRLRVLELVYYLQTIQEK